MGNQTARKEVEKLGTSAHSGIGFGMARTTGEMKTSACSCQGRRGQTALEYLMIIGGLVVLVLMVIMLLNSAVFSQAVNAMNQSLSALGPIKK